MTEYIRRRTPLALLAVLALAACGGNKTDASLKSDSALNRDLALANRDSTSQPALTDVPAPPPAATPAPAPVTPRASSTPRTTPRTTPRPTRPSTPAPTTTPSGNTVTPGKSGGGSVGMIDAGTTIALTSNSRVCTNTHHVGDRFTATVADAVTGTNGAVIPAGATATVEVTALKRSENANDKINVGLRVVSLTFGGHTYNVDASTQSAQVDRVRNQPKDKDVQKVVGGAVLGAIAGRIIGKDTKGTVIGAAAGAAAGTAAAAATANYEGCVPDGGRIVIKLDAPTQIKA